MVSPFPGMDPYLEQHWGDVHTRLITYASDQLQERLPRDLRCRVEERVCVEPDEGKPRSIYPDVRIVERPGMPAGAGDSGGIATAEPLLLSVLDEPETERFLEIIDLATGKRVVTVIEVLSLANKSPGASQDQYLKKQRELRDAGVSLVEIELLRSGQRVQSIPERKVPRRSRTAYRACVRRGWAPDPIEFYPIPLRETLQSIRIPLRQADADVVLELQPLIEMCYRRGRYDDMDYAIPADPPLEGADAKWADELLRTASKRT